MATNNTAAQRVPPELWLNILQDQVLNMDDLTSARLVNRQLLNVVESTALFRRERFLRQQPLRAGDTATSTQLGYNKPNSLIFPPTRLQVEKVRFTVPSDEGYVYTTWSTRETQAPGAVPVNQRTRWFKLWVQRSRAVPGQEKGVKELPAALLSTFTCSHAGSMMIEGAQRIRSSYTGSVTPVHQTVQMPPGATVQGVLDHLKRKRVEAGEIRGARVVDLVEGLFVRDGIGWHLVRCGLMYVAATVLCLLVRKD